MSSSAFYFKLNRKLDKNQPVGSIITALDNLESNTMKPSGDIIDLNDFPLVQALNLNNSLKAIETNILPLTSQVPLTQVASSPNEIVALGLNSKIYRTTNGESWTSSDCPAVGGAFTGSIFLDYAPSLGKFYIVHRMGSSSTTEFIHTSFDGIGWDSNDYGSIPAPNPPTSNTDQGPNNTTWATKWVPHLSAFARPFTWVTYTVVSHDNVADNPTITQYPCYMYAWLDETRVYHTALKYNLLNSSPSISSDISSVSWELITQLFNCAPWNSSYWYGGISTYPGQFETCSDHVFAHFGLPSSIIHCVNGNYQNKIFFRTGYTTEPNTFTAYTNSFSFPTNNIAMVYDVQNTKYIALNKDSNQCYVSTNGTTWSNPLTIDGGVCTIDNIAIRHNQSRLIAVGATIKTSDNSAVSWTTQNFPTLGGNFTKIAISPSGVCVVSPLASTTIARATTATNFDLEEVGATGDWQNVYWDGTKFILTSRTLQLKTSSDGITWATQTNHTPFTNSSHYIFSMSNYLTNYCAISNSSPDTLTSTDGITWVKRTSTIATGCNSVCMTKLLDDSIITVIVGTNCAYFNTDYGVSTFSNSSSSIGTGNWSNLIWADGKFVCISLNSNKVAYSINGISWILKSLPFIPCSIVYAVDKFVIKGSYQLTTTEDLINFNVLQPCEDTTSGAKTIYDSVNDKIITANNTSVAYATIVDTTKVRLPYIACDTDGFTNYIKVS